MEFTPTLMQTFQKTEYPRKLPTIRSPKTSILLYPFAFLTLGPDVPLGLQDPFF
ncbi:MAG: hypothetical protein IID32_06025 [Planctomycetes bacterium]|nr:hypothetical protein [Planctomycetota bacterium]